MDGEDNGTMFLTEELLVENFTSTILQTTTVSTPVDSPYAPDYFRIAWLIAKCILGLVVVSLSLAIRKRDFLKVFVLVLLLPLLLEVAVDVSVEILQCLSLLGQNGSNSLQLLLSVLRNYIFWSSFFSSVVAFYFSHKAVTKPVKMKYTIFHEAYLKAQIFPFILTVLNAVMFSFDLPDNVKWASSILTFVMACLVGSVLFLQAILSLPVFCFRRDEFATSCPHDQIRHSKSRLFWFIIFQIAIQAMNAPFIIYARYQLEQDFCLLFGLPVSIPLSPVMAASDLHFRFLRVRPLFFLLFIILFLSPYRRKLTKSVCSRCARD